MNYNNIPFELRSYRQWVLWKFEEVNGKMTKVPYAPNGFKASIINPQTWTDFDTACNYANKFNGIGFVLTDDDPFCFIDLDQTDVAEEQERQQLVIANFSETYSETSPSGKGLHIICRAKTESGKRRGSIEMYSSKRFMTMTGNVFNYAPISNCQNKIDNMYKAFTKAERDYSVSDEPETYSDERIYTMAYNAENGEKFYDLYTGNWQKYYGSQSEADHALINIIAFYSRNSTQINRIFQRSKLALRDKAKRADYVGSMIRRSFDNHTPTINIAENAFRQREELAKGLDLQKGKNPFEQQKGNLCLALLTQAELFPSEINKGVEVEFQKLHETNSMITYGENVLIEDFNALPNGYIKEIARFVYAQSPRPSATISLITALGIMAGICGRSYNVSGTGLNNYFVLLGATGIGKEGMAKGINKLIGSVADEQPMANSFVGLGELVSGTALLRYLSEESKCCVTIQGEFGMTMQRMTGRMATPHMLQLRKILLDLYGKSGRGEVLRATNYADKAKNIEALESPAFSMLAESTPETFYECLSDSLVDEGLMSRFNVIECDSQRPPLNKNHVNVTVPADLRNFILTLTTNCLTLNATDKVINVDIDETAQQMLDEIDSFCDDKINSYVANTYRQLWNRGHLKVLKIAGLLAVADNIYTPTIKGIHVAFARDFVFNSISTLMGRYESGEIGSDSVSDKKRIYDLARVIGNMVMNLKNIKLPHADMADDFVIPHSVLTPRLCNLKSFKISSVSQSILIKNTLMALVDVGVLEEVRKHIAKEKYSFSGTCWAITDIRYFLDIANNRNYNLV